MHGGYQNSSYNTVVSEPPEDEGRIDYILLCYQFFSIYIVISMLILLVWDVYFVFKTILLSKDMTQVLLQMYNPVFALIAIGIEADLTDILRGNALMQSWTFRGQSYFFIGLLNKAQFRCPAWTVSSITMLYNSILSGNFMVIGVIYLCLGLLNAKKIKDEKMAKYITLLSMHEMEQIMEGQMEHSMEEQ